MEMESSAEAKARRQIEFDEKFKPKQRTTVHRERELEPEPEPEPADEAVLERQRRLYALEEEQRRLREERMYEAIEDSFARERIRPQGIHSFKRLQAEVTRLGWKEKQTGGGGHHVFERTFTTAAGSQTRQVVTVAATTSDSARGYKNMIKEFNKKTREKLGLCYEDE
jgi:hypothetical protein